MKRFLIKCLFYTVIFIGLLSILTTAVDCGLKIVNDNLFGDWNRLLGDQIKDDIIVVGNSRAKVHFDPILIEKLTGLSCYNLGKDATDLFQQQTVINSIVESQIHPKYVVLSTDINSLPKKSEIFEKQAYLPYLNNSFISNVLEEVDQQVVYERTLPFIKYRGYPEIILKGLLRHFKKDNEYSRTKGFEPQNRIWNNDFSKFQKMMGNEKIVLSEDEVNEGFKILQHIIDVCKSKGIGVIIVQPPRYCELYEYFPQKEKIDIQIQNLSITNDIFYLDYSHSNISLDKSFFYNASHLNARGAQIFTTKLCNDLNKLPL
ncbi:DUF1574 family protein [Carboxylicivirga taeanensis]|uniref:DUF1574 family protein n=1 Tax=Carboxylicivirga taeanensis TaxID=1416875 RepID=UPI003F6E4001